jgi:Kef-type K+ transport system membrane component KefB
MLLPACMLGLAEVFGLDVLLGAFAAGVLTRLVLRRAVPEAGEEVVGKVEAMGFGFLVALFYVVTGIEFDLDALLHDPVALSLVPVFPVLCLVARGGPVYVLAPKDLRRADRTALALFASTCLPLVVAITTIGVDQGLLGTDRAAALVGAAMISVLVLPLLATRLRKASGVAAGASAANPGRRGGRRTTRRRGERGGVRPGGPPPRRSGRVAVRGRCERVGTEVREGSLR